MIVQLGVLSQFHVKLKCSWCWCCVVVELGLWSFYRVIFFGMYPSPPFGIFPQFPHGIIFIAPPCINSNITNYVQREIPIFPPSKVPSKQSEQNPPIRQCDMQPQLATNHLTLSPTLVCSWWINLLSHLLIIVCWHVSCNHHVCWYVSNNYNVCWHVSYIFLTIIMFVGMHLTTVMFLDMYHIIMMFFCHVYYNCHVYWNVSCNY